MAARNPLLYALIILSAALAACTSYAPDDPIPPSAELRAIEGTSWLVRRVTFSEGNDRGDYHTAAGFDLDGFDSTVFGMTEAARCNEFQPDHHSELDLGLTGIDNAGASLITLGEQLTESRFADSLDQAVQEGSLRWALRVGALSESEERIELELFVIEAGETLAFDADGMPAPGQRLGARRVAQTSALVRRSVAWGRTDSRALTVDGEVLLLPFDDFQLGAFGVEAQPTADLLYANLGGSFSVDALTAAAVRDTSEAYAEPSQLAFEVAADLQPSALDPSVCERVSVGFGLDAVPVELVGD